MHHGYTAAVCTDTHMKYACERGREVYKGSGFNHSAVQFNTFIDGKATEPLSSFRQIGVFPITEQHSLGLLAAHAHKTHTHTHTHTLSHTANHL